jgi:hypothetical protein
MPEFHKYVGFVVNGVFLVGWVWGLGGWLFFRRRGGAGSKYWIWLAVAQVVALAQAVIGTVLLILGYRPDTWLHLVYGYGPLAVLAIAHNLAREGQKVTQGQDPIPAYLFFTAAAFICWGLTLRALMTGLGMA